MRDTELNQIVKNIMLVVFSSTNVYFDSLVVSSMKFTKFISKHYDKKNWKVMHKLTSKKVNKIGR